MAENRIGGPGRGEIQASAQGLAPAPAAKAPLTGQEDSAARPHPSNEPGRVPIKTVLVTGGRDFRDKAKVYNTLNEIDRRHGLTALVHGGASGADTLAGMWATEQGLLVWVHPADWAKYGTAAGPIRNQEMLERGKPDLVVAFPGGRGTADMVRRARAAGVKVTEVPRRSPHPAGGTHG